MGKTMTDDHGGRGLERPDPDTVYSEPDDELPPITEDVREDIRDPYKPIPGYTERRDWPGIGIKNNSEWFNGIVNDIVTGFSPVVIVCGREGTGKTEATLELVRLLYNEVNALQGTLTPENVTEPRVYDPIPFVERVIGLRREAVVFEEAGRQLPATRWWSKFNKAVRDTIQTQRVRGIPWIFVLPKAYRLDSGIRDRARARLECVEKGKVEVTMWEYNFGQMQNNDKTRSIIYHKKRGAWFPDRPPKNLREAYKGSDVAKKKGIMREIEKDVREEFGEDGDGDTGPSADDILMG